MKLTPIKVRGKRGQQKSLRDHSSKAIGHPETKRARKHHPKSNDGITGTLMRSKVIPRLLQLPQEVLERVFISSKNLALPRVNRELFRRLSTESIKYQLLGAAFGPTWDAWYGLDNARVLSYHGWNSDTDRIAGDAAFQVSQCSAQLRCLRQCPPPYVDAHLSLRSSPAPGQSCPCCSLHSTSGSGSTPVGAPISSYPA